MMKNIKNRASGEKLFFVVLVISVAAGCSSSSNLRKFNDDNDLGKEIPVEVAKKFEVKDVTAATPTPTPAVVIKKGKKVVVQKKPKKGSAKVVEPIVPPVRRVDPTPFAVGEKLQYGIRYIGVTAAYFNLEVLPFKIVNDRKVFHLQGKAKTVSLFNLVYRVDDTIESFWDYEGLYSNRYTMELDESKQSRKLIELYDYEKKKSYFWNRVDHVDKGYSEQKEEYDIALWSQDPISSLYYIRTLDLPKEPGKEFRFPVILDGKPWEIILHYIGKEKIYAGGQYYEADKYQLDTFTNGEIKNGNNSLWLSADEHRYVLRLEAKVKVGSFAIALDKVL
jgi:hypothetical protein